MHEENILILPRFKVTVLG